MEIITMDRTKIETDKLNDLEAEMIELVTKSGIREFAIKHGGISFTTIYIPNIAGWSSMHLPSQESMMRVIGVVNDLLFRSTKGNFSLAIIPTPPQPEQKKEDGNVL